jgi:hypothetical protein
VTDRPCWEIRPKFCASLSNGHGRCKKGTCFVIDVKPWPPQGSLFEAERADER